MAKLTTRGNELNPYKIIQRLEDIRDLDVDGWEEFPEAVNDLIEDIYSQLDLPR